MRPLFVIIAALSLSGCASMALREQEAAFNDADLALVTCQGQKFSTYEAKISCVSDGMVSAFKKHNSPYVDLAINTGNRSLIIAKQIDAGQIDAKQGEQQILAGFNQMDQQISNRQQADANRRAAMAGALAGWSAGLQRQAAPVGTNCTATTPGNTTYIHCQ